MLSFEGEEPVESLYRLRGPWQGQEIAHYTHQAPGGGEA
jgi:hypothetical protein